MAQRLSHYPSIDYDELYSLVMDIIAFRYLISSSVHEN